MTDTTHGTPLGRQATSLHGSNRSLAPRKKTQEHRRDTKLWSLAANLRE